jgi:hypothetical protein
MCTLIEFIHLFSQLFNASVIMRNTCSYVVSYFLDIRPEAFSDLTRFNIPAGPASFDLFIKAVFNAST